MFKKLLPIFLLNFVNVVGFSILFSILPTILDEFIGTQEERPFAHPVTYGAILSTYAFFQFLGAPILGSLSDKFGRRPVLLITQLGTFLSWVVFGLAFLIDEDIMIWELPLPIVIIAFARIVDGVTGGNISVANAFVSDVTQPKDRTKIYGFLGAIFGIGLATGPAIGGLAYSAAGFLGFVAFELLLSGITLLVMYFNLPESLPKEKRDEHIDLNPFRQFNIFRQMSKLKNKTLYNLFFFRIFFALVFASYTSIIILFISRKFGYNEPQEAGLIFLAIGVYLIFNQGFLVNRVTKRIGLIKTYYIGQFILIASLSSLVFVETIWAFLLVAYINNVGLSFALPTFKGIITKIANEKQQGLVTGIDESLLALSNAVVPIISAAVYSELFEFTFAAFAVFLIIPFVVYFCLNRKFYVWQDK